MAGMKHILVHLYGAAAFALFAISASWWYETLKNPYRMPEVGPFGWALLTTIGFAATVRYFAWCQYGSALLPKFSVRTLLIVVTLICVWFGWQWRIVHERKAVLNLVKQLEGWPQTPYDTDLSSVPAYVRVPIVRQWLGDQPLYAIRLPSRPAPDRPTIDRMRSAFPEAEIVLWDFDIATDRMKAFESTWWSEKEGSELDY
jgi:hypothetical protein